jgi:hypothetical protein
MMSEKIILPNAETWTEIPNFDWSEFEPTDELHDRIFGKYQGVYICVLK